MDGAPIDVHTTKNEVDQMVTTLKGCWWSVQGQGLLPTGPPASLPTLPALRVKQAFMPTQLFF